jgi:hypothetical protein
MPKRTPEPVAGEIYIEFSRVGAFVKCAALDAATGIEVAVTGPVSAAPADLEKLALRKLERRLAAS